ncbi:hypothetical protein GGX14DRAFT_391327 [Mycena pura]|uniref:Uncharacterized protein n=1 Tax=Mycena pura TaxID=153505 RepID=A0AAD6VQH7_9AGAR|nr:hypothetical protein GGX14DRAFT_391327 [Mycena pura]
MRATPGQWRELGSISRSPRISRQNDELDRQDYLVFRHLKKFRPFSEAFPNYDDKLPAWHMNKAISYFEAKMSTVHQLRKEDTIFRSHAQDSLNPIVARSYQLYPDTSQENHKTDLALPRPAGSLPSSVLHHEVSYSLQEHQRHISGDAGLATREIFEDTPEQDKKKIQTGKRVQETLTAWAKPVKTETNQWDNRGPFTFNWE